MNTAPSDGANPRPPAPGTRVGEVAVFYTETARAAVPSFDLELVPLAGKNPGVGGLAWQTHASSEMGELRDRLIGLGTAGRRINGWGALMNRHIAFDVDHPEHMPPGLSLLVIQGLFNETRPGRGHWLFRVPLGMRFGGRKDRINEAFPPVGGGSWGEIKGFNSQVRIWSPNEDGSHVALVPGEIPDLPPELAVLLMEPEYRYGDPMTSTALDDWLADQTEARHPEWLEADVARLPEIDPADTDNSKNRRCLRRIWHIGMNCAAGMYEGRRAYDELHEAWVALCIAEGDYVTDGGPEDHERKYRDIWRRAVGKLTVDPGALVAIEEKRSWTGSTIPWDPEHNESDRLLETLWTSIAVSSGVAIGAASTELSTVELTAMLEAVDPDDEREQVLVEPGGQVFDLASRVAAKLARIEGSSTNEQKPEHQAVAGSDNGDEEIRGSSLVEAAAAPGAELPPERETVAVGAGVEPPAPAPEPGDSWEQYCQSVVDEHRPAVNAALREMAIKEMAVLRKRMLSGVGEIEAVDFDDLDDAPALDPPPTLMMVNAEHGLLYEDAVTMMIGDKSAGKSWLMLAEALIQMRAGRTVAWLDWEMSAAWLRSRLKALGATSADVRGRWRYLGMHGAEFRDGRKALGALPVGALLVVDSVSQALGSGGSDEDKASEYGPWIAAVKQFRAEVSACVVMIDHTGHTNKTRARGSSAKGQQADVEYTMAVVDPWTRTKEGWASLACRKDRGGHLKLERPHYGAFFAPGMRGGLGSGSLDVRVRELTEWEVVFAERAMLDERERAKIAKEAAAEATRREEDERVEAVMSDGERHSRKEIAAEASVGERIVDRVVDAMLADGRALKMGTTGPKAGVRLATDVERAAGLTGSVPE